jgi:SAM-dependent methyltransferase
MAPRFWELHSGHDREGPGDTADTMRALALTGLGGPLDILDIACGPGPSALDLLGALPEARVTGLDAHQPFLDHAERRIAAAGHAARFSTVLGDMAAPPFDPGTFDLIWCEGAAYIIGVETALRAWKPLLRPGGRLAFTEAIWLTAAPHPRARSLWTEYPAMADAAGVRDRIAAAGYALLGDFVISDRAWDNYYLPHGPRLDALEVLHGNDDAVLGEAREEIAVRRDHAAEYGYGFFVTAPA